MIDTWGLGQDLLAARCHAKVPSFFFLSLCESWLLLLPL